MLTATKDRVDISAIYDRIYNIADRLFKQHNPCDIHIVNKDIKCTSRKTSVACGLCCSRCKYISKTGCTIKCLPCKLFICSCLMIKKHKSFTGRIGWLKDIAWNHGIGTSAFFCTKSKILRARKRRIDYDNKRTLQPRKSGQ